MLPALDWFKEVVSNMGKSPEQTIKESSEPIAEHPKHGEKVVEHQGEQIVVPKGYEEETFLPGPQTDIDWYSELKQDPSFRDQFGDRSNQLFEMPDIIETTDPLPPTKHLTAGTIEEPQARINYFAEQRGIDPSRYGIVDGQIVYVDKGVLMKEGGRAGQITGDVALPIAGAIAGGVIAGPGGSALGGMFGESVNKLIGMYHGDEQSFSGNLFDIGVEGILSAAGWKLGELGGKKIIDRRVVKDIKNFDKEKADALIKMSREKFGIDLTPAEATDLGSLIAQQTRLGMSFDDAADVIRKFYINRAQQVKTAVDDFIGPTPMPQVAGQKARDVMKTTIDDAYKARSTAASPIYKPTIRKDVLVPEEDLRTFLDDPYIYKKFQQVMTDPKIGINGAEVNSTKVIDEVKKAIDDEWETLIRQGNKNAAANVRQKGNALKAYVDKLYPSYEEARRAFQAMSKPIDELEQGIEGVIAGMKNTSLKNVAKTLLDPKADPRAIRNARTNFVTQGEEKAWDDLVNVYLRDTWETLATKETAAGHAFNAGGKWRSMVYGSDRAKANLKAAMGEERFQVFEDLMDVLQAASRVPKGQSMTQPAMEMAAREGFENAPFVTMATDVNIAQPLKSFNLAQWWTDAKVSNWHTYIAKTITNPGALDELKTLRGLSPTSQKAIDIVSLALVKSGAVSAGETFNPDSDQTPEVLQ